MASRRPSITLDLIRCGESIWEREDRLHGSTDLPLCEAGGASVEACASFFADVRIPTVYHPPDEASAETAKIIAAVAKARTKTVEELGDPNLGLLEGLLKQEFAERHPKRYRQWEEDPLSLAPPEGEPIADARARIFKALARLLKRSRADEVAVVLRPVSLGLFRCWLDDAPVEQLWSMVTDRPAVERYLLARPLIERLSAAAEPIAVVA